MISFFSLDRYDKSINTYSGKRGKKKNNVAIEEHRAEIVTYLIADKIFSEIIVKIAY